MKRYVSPVLALILLCLLSGAALAAPTYTVTIPGHNAQVTVDSPQRLSVLVDGDTYTYERNGNSSHIAGPASASTSTVEVADLVVQEFKRQHPDWDTSQRKPKQAWQVLGGLLLAGLGILGLLKPDVAWFLQEGWKFRDAEPSDAALIMTRLGGVVAVIIGLLLMF